MSSAIQHGPIDSAGSRLAAIVLAAGYSSRMGSFKPLLRVGGRTALERSIDLFRAAGVEEVIAVLGHRAEELRSTAERCGARCALNQRFERGMYSSIVVGSRALPRWAKAAFVLPADIPLVRPSTVRKLAQEWARWQDGIAYPVFDGRRGHPPLIARKILDFAKEEGAEGPLSVFLASHERDAIEVPVVDEAIHMDMDTRADYEALAALATQREIPTPLECEAILAGLHVEESIIAHSRKVAEVATKIAGALLRNGVELNAELVQAGALLHDVAKGQPNHAVVGASILRGMDFDQVADVVATHTELGSFADLDETAIVYLADKLVRGVKVVALKERFAPALTRFKKDAEALKAARRRMQNATDVARAVEARVGADLKSIINGEFDLNDRDGAEMRGNSVRTR
ncbi:MAG: DVU_1551 family NTP transferase [Terracidiphilus sp.]